MFSIEQVQLQFNVNNDITCLKINNNILYLATQSIVYRIDLNHPEVVAEFHIIAAATDNNQDHIESLFLDPKGYHLIVKTHNLSYHYINKDFTQSKILPKLKGFDVTCAEYCFHDTDDDYIQLNNTGSILLGTTSGILYELIIDISNASNNEYFNSRGIEKILKQVYKFEPPLPILAISVITTPDQSFTVSVLTAKTYLVFENYKTLKFHHKSSNFNELSRTKPRLVNTSQLQKLSAHNQRTFCSVGNNDEVMLMYEQLQQQPLSPVKFKIPQSVKSLLLTQFHIFLLADSELLCYNQLNSQLTSQQSLDDLDETFLGLSLDLVENTFWLYSSSNIYEILIENESKDIWQIMLTQKLYDELLSTLNDNDLYTRDLILIKKAEDLQKNGSKNPDDLLKAAEIFSQTSKSTEEVLLLFKDHLQASIIYLSKKLDKVPKLQVMQKITLTSWIVELYMELLNNLDNEIHNYSSDLLNDMGAPSSVPEAGSDSAASNLRQFTNEFSRFIKQNLKTLHKETIYQIISSHNRKSELLFYANLIKDYDVVLDYHINLGQWTELLKVLLLLFGKNSDNDEENLNYVYRYSSVLMMNEPEQTISTWMKINDFVELDFNKLLPAMTTYNKIVCNIVKPSDNEALKLLKYLIDHKFKKDKMIHNTYLCLLISYPFGDGETEVLKYLEKNVSDNGSGHGHQLTSTNKEILFDIDFILRLCNKYDKIKAIIYIYTISGDYEDAVDLALENNLIELASNIANRPAISQLNFGFDDKDDEKNRLRKKLWLKISSKLIKEVLRNDKYLVQNKNEIVVAVTGTSTTEHKGKPIDLNKKNDNIQLVLTYIMEKANKNPSSDLKLLITIQDLLNLFPDFTVIDNFKEEIVSSLEEYSSSLAKLNHEMNKLLVTCVNLKKEQKELCENRFLTVEPKESCSLCNKLLVTRKFFTYPCFHSFHQDCLVNCYKEGKDYKIKNKLYILEKKLVNFKKLNDSEGTTQIKHEIDETLKERCVYCVMKISEIDEPFMNDDDF